jgi:hypothetical protein
VLAILKHIRYPYLWKWRRPDRPLGKLGSSAYGWATNQMSKPWMVGAMQHHLTKRSIVLHDATTYLEMMGYTLMDGGDMGPASRDGTDDTVMALMIALMTHLESDPPDFAAVYGFDTGPGTRAPQPVGASGYDAPEEFRELD